MLALLFSALSILELITALKLNFQVWCRHQLGIKSMTLLSHCCHIEWVMRCHLVNHGLFDNEKFQVDQCPSCPPYSTVSRQKWIKIIRNQHANEVSGGQSWIKYYFVGERDSQDPHQYQSLLTNLVGTLSVRLTLSAIVHLSVPCKGLLDVSSIASYSRHGRIDWSGPGRFVTFGI